MIGGDPFILDEQVASLPRDRVRSRIEMVWPHESAEVATATRVNVTAQLLLPGSADDPVPCRYKPEQVQLWRRFNGGPPELVANGVRRLAEEPGLRYPVWDFNDVNVERARAPEGSYELYILVDGLETDRESWIYGGPTPTDWTQPPVRPAHGCA